MEIQKRLAEIHVQYSCPIGATDPVIVRESNDAFKVLMTIWDRGLIAYQESFVVVLLNRAGMVLGYRWVSHGGLAGVVVDPKHIFGLALTCNAAGIVLAHNHPSGNVRPSKLDIKLTETLVAGAELLDLRIVDHLIVTPQNTYYSFVDNGMLSLGG